MNDREHAESVTEKVFDTDSNPVTARLLVWGPEEVDGEVCVIAEPTDFFSTAPSEHYEGQDRPTLAADDLRIAIPVRLIDVGKLTCRTTGEDLHMSRGEALALLSMLQEEPAVIRRRLEVLLGEKTLGQVDDEAERERRNPEPVQLTAAARAVIAGCVADSEDIDAEPIADGAVWNEIRAAFPVELFKVAGEEIGIDYVWPSA